MSNVKSTRINVELSEVNLYASSDSKRRSSVLSGSYIVDSEDVISEEGRIHVYELLESGEEKLLGWIAYSNDLFSSSEESEDNVEESTENQDFSASLSIQKGDLVRIKPEVNFFRDCRQFPVKIPETMKRSPVYVRSNPANGEIFVSSNSTGSVLGTLYLSDLIKER